MRRKRRSLADALGSYTRGLNNIHGLKRNTLKSAYHCGWKRWMDSYSGNTVYRRLEHGTFIAQGIDKGLVHVHGCMDKVNKNFRKIEP